MTQYTNRLFRAFADETRLRILNLLAQEKELCVCDIMAVLRLPQSKVSRHLGYLRNSGLVVDRRNGLWIYYALSKPAGTFHKSLVSCLGGCFREVGVLKKDVAALHRFKGPKGTNCNA